MKLASAGEGKELLEALASVGDELASLAVLLPVRPKPSYKKFKREDMDALLSLLSTGVTKADNAKAMALFNRMLAKSELEKQQIANESKILLDETSALVRSTMPHQRSSQALEEADF